MPDELCLRCLNALAGIFCFSTGDPNNERFRCYVATLSQCPRGHFLFFNPSVRRLSGSARWLVSMPSRAFFVFQLTKLVKYGKYVSMESQCPRGHFLFFNLIEKAVTAGLKLKKSQCPRGHFLFFNKMVAYSGKTRNISPGLNALAGIFCFSTLVIAEYTVTR